MKIPKYDKLTKTGAIQKWGLANWMIFAADQEYGYNGQVETTPTSIKRLAPLFAIKTIPSKDEPRVELVECEIVVSKENYERDVAELKRVFKKEQG